MACKGEDSAPESAILGWKEDVIVGGVGREPIIALGQSPIDPGVQKRPRIGVFPTAADVLKPPLEWVDEPVVIDRPSGVLIPADSLLKPGHALQDLNIDLG